MSTNTVAGKKLLSFLIPLVIGAVIWFIPVPEGLTPAAWHMFAIFCRHHCGNPDPAAPFGGGHADCALRGDL